MQEVEAEIELSENTSVCPVEIWMPCAHAFSLSLLHTALTRSTEFLSLSQPSYSSSRPPTPDTLPFPISFFHTHCHSLSSHMRTLSLSLSPGTHSFAVTQALSCTYIWFIYSTNILFLYFCLSRTGMSISFFYVTKAIFVKEYQLVINCAHTKRFSTSGMRPKMHHRSVSIRWQTATWCKMQKSRSWTKPIISIKSRTIHTYCVYVFAHTHMLLLYTTGVDTPVHSW